MMFNIASFLTFALALPSLDAVTAVSVSKRVDGGHLSKRDSENITIEYFDVPKGGFFTACGNFITTNDSLSVALPASRFAGGSHCNKTVILSFDSGQKSSEVSVTVTDVCAACDKSVVIVSQDAFIGLNNGSLAEGVLNGKFTPGANY